MWHDSHASFLARNFVSPYLTREPKARVATFAVGKKCWARSMKKWLFKNQPQEVAGFLPLIQPPLETAPQFAMAHALQAGTIQPLLGTVLGTTHIHLTRLVGVKGWVESQVLWCNTHNVRVDVRMDELATL